jgi:muramidase (phage lysozyme)
VDKATATQRAIAVTAVSFVAVIQWAEGTAGAADPYRTRYTFEQVPIGVPQDSHPYWHDKRIPCGIINGRNVCSAASGALQWMPDTWEAALQKCGDRLDPNHPQFSPINQDRVGLCWVEHYGAISNLVKGLKVLNGQPIVSRESFDRSIQSICGEWASLPCRDGDSQGAHGQGARHGDRLWEQFLVEIGKRNKTTGFR